MKSQHSTFTFFFVVLGLLLNINMYAGPSESNKICNVMALSEGQESILYSEEIFPIIEKDNTEENTETVSLKLHSNEGGTLYFNDDPICETTKEVDVKKGTVIKLRCIPKNGYELTKLSVNGILKDVQDNEYSFVIKRLSIVNVTFSAIKPAAKVEIKSEEDRAKFLIKVSGSGKATFSGEINGVVAGNIDSPQNINSEEFYVKNGSNVTIKLEPIININKFIVEGRDLTQAIKSTNGIYTVGVSHTYPKFGITSVLAEFIQRYKVEIACNKFGMVNTSQNIKKTTYSTNYIIDKGKKEQISFIANKHCYLSSLIVNDIDVTNKVKNTSTSSEGEKKSYYYDLGVVDRDYKIKAIFSQKPKLIITCGKNGSVDRAMDLGDPTGYVHYLDPDYSINSGETKIFYEPSAALSSNFNGKSWVLRTYANEGFKLAKLTVNGTDMTSHVRKISPSSVSSRINREICYLLLGMINIDTRIEVSFKKIEQHTQRADWVDLGIGVKWATRNVGANSEYEVGNYYTWQEANSLKVQKGRLPTYNEIQQLINHCHPEFTQQNGVNGIRFYHKSNRSISIFIPAAGIYPENNPDKIVEYANEGAIWTASQTTASNKVNQAVKEQTMNPIWLLIGDAFSSVEYDRAALAFDVKEKVVKLIDADIGARISVRLVLDK